MLELEGQNHGYYVNGSKSWLIVKSEQTAERARAVFGKSVNITTDGKRHLGAVLGSAEYRKEYCEEIVSNWVKELTTLCEIAETQPQTAYSAYTKGYRSKFTYFLRTIENFEEFLTPIDTLLSERFIPTLFGCESAINDYREVFSLNPKEGGLGINILSQEAAEQHMASTKNTQPHVESIIQQETIMRDIDSNGKTITELRQENNSHRSERRKENTKQIIDNLPEDTKTFVEQARDKGASSWLNALPIEEQRFVMNKEEFRDALRLRYNMPLKHMPSFCTCGERFDVSHALSWVASLHRDTIPQETSSHLY